MLQFRPYAAVPGVAQELVHLTFQRSEMFRTVPVVCVFFNSLLLLRKIRALFVTGMTDSSLL